MTSRPSPATPPAPTRRMLERPETLDVVGGLERFRCLDIMGGTLLSRASCAARWRSETSRASGAARQGAADGPMPHMPCVGCPVGRLHADEQRAGTVPRLTVVQGRHATSQARRPAPAHVEAPAAVVPAKRTSSRPAAIEPTAQTPDPLHADAQQAVDAGNPVGADDRSGPPESPSPPVVEPPLPPSGEQAAGGRRARTVTCPDCGTVVPRTSNQQVRCGSCGTQRNRAATAARNRLRRVRARAPSGSRPRAVAASTGAHGPLPGILITHDGTTDTIEGWATRTGLSSKTIRRRWAKGLRGSDLLGPRRDARADHDRRRAGSAVERSAPAKAAERLPTVERPVEAPEAVERRQEARPLALAPLSDPERLMAATARYAVATDRADRANAAHEIRELADALVSSADPPPWISLLRAFGLRAEDLATSFDVEGRAVLLCRVEPAPGTIRAAHAWYAGISALASAIGHEVVCSVVPADTDDARIVGISVPLDSWEAWCT